MRVIPREICTVYVYIATGNLQNVNSFFKQTCGEAINAAGFIQDAQLTMLKCYFIIIGDGETVSNHLRINNLVCALPLHRHISPKNSMIPLRS